MSKNVAAAVKGQKLLSFFCLKYLKKNAKQTDKDKIESIPRAAPEASMPVSLMIVFGR